MPVRNQECETFLLENPNLNLYLPLESGGGGGDLIHILLWFDGISLGLQKMWEKKTRTQMGWNVFFFTWVARGGLPSMMFRK